MPSEKIKCPQCRVPVFSFLIEVRPNAEAKCDDCYNNELRATHARQPRPTLSIEDIRRKRNLLLAETDIWELPSIQARADNKLNKRRETYRQRLRDITENLDLTAVRRLDEIDWPDHPDAEQTSGSETDVPDIDTGSGPADG